MPLGISRRERCAQNVIEEPFAGVVLRSSFRTERRSLFHLPQGGKAAPVHFLRAGSFRLGFDKELVARFRDGALRRQLLKSVADGLGIGAVDACLELDVHLDHQLITTALDCGLTTAGLHPNDTISRSMGK